MTGRGESEICAASSTHHTALVRLCRSSCLYHPSTTTLIPDACLRLLHWRFHEQHRTLPACAAHAVRLRKLRRAWPACYPLRALPCLAAPRWQTGARWRGNPPPPPGRRVLHCADTTSDAALVVQVARQTHFWLPPPHLPPTYPPVHFPSHSPSHHLHSFSHLQALLALFCHSLFLRMPAPSCPHVLFTLPVPTDFSPTAWTMAFIYFICLVPHTYRKSSLFWFYLFFGIMPL